MPVARKDWQPMGVSIPALETRRHTMHQTSFGSQSSFKLAHCQNSPLQTAHYSPLPYIASLSRSAIHRSLLSFRPATIALRSAPPVNPCPAALVLAAQNAAPRFASGTPPGLRGLTAPLCAQKRGLSKEQKMVVICTALGGAVKPN